MMRKCFAFVAVTLLLSMMPVLESIVHATSTWYVAPMGTGGGSCATPNFNTISAAVAAASPGDTIIVCAGTYNEVVNVNKLLTLYGEGGPIIKPDDTTALLDQGRRRVAIYITANDVAVEGFEIDGTGGTVHYGIYGFNTNGVAVKANTIHDIVNQIAYPVSDVAGVGILFFGWGQGINGVTIDRNTVYNTGRMGVFVGGMQSGSPYNWLLSDGDTIARNNVYSTWLGPTNDYGAGIQMNGAKNPVIDSNNVHHAGQPTTGTFYPGIYLYGTVGGAVSRNNVHQNLYGVVIWVSAPLVVFGTNVPIQPTPSRNNLHNNSIQDLWIIP